MGGFEIMFLMVFVLIFGMILVMIVRGIGEWGRITGLPGWTYLQRLFPNVHIP